MGYCLRWHEFCDDTSCDNVAGVLKYNDCAQWSFSRNEYIFHYVLQHDYGLATGVMDSHSMSFFFHLINPEDWDYLRDEGGI